MTTTILAGRIRALPLLGCALAAAASWWTSQHTIGLAHVELLVGIWFFGAATAALLIIPRFTTLRLDAEGITQRSFARTHFFAWHDVTNVSIERLRGHPFVAVDRASGFDPRTYGVTARELLELIEQARRGP